MNLYFLSYSAWSGSNIATNMVRLKGQFIMGFFADPHNAVLLGTIKLLPNMLRNV